MGSRKCRILAAVLLSLVLIATATGVVYAYLSTTAGPLNNSMTPASNPNMTIVETFTTAPGSTDRVKENVRVNVGKPGYAVYVRVALVVTWQKDGNYVYGQAPIEGTDYELIWNEEAWEKGSDGFYYLTSKFIGDNTNGGKTPVFITSCSQTKDGPDGYELHVEVIAQTIQAKGGTDLDDTPAVETAWGVKVNGDGTLDVS